MLGNYIIAKELFPNWYTAEVLLVSFVQGISDEWEVAYNHINNSCEVLLGFPQVKDELSGNYVPMLLTFPEIYQQKITNICYEIMYERIPDLNKYIHTPICDHIKNCILQDVFNRERQILAEGGRCLKEEFAFRLGVYFAYLGVKGKDVQHGK